MTATGFAFFVSPLLGQIDARARRTRAWILLVDFWIFFFVALILTLLTSGRLQPRLDRWLVAAFALPLVHRCQLAWLLFPDLDGGPPAARLPATRTSPHAIDRPQRGLLAGLLRRDGASWSPCAGGASPPRRRALLPSLAGALRAAVASPRCW